MMSVQNEQTPIPPSFFWMQPPGERRLSDAPTSPVDVKAEFPRGRRLSDFNSGGDRSSVSPRRLGPNDDGEDEFVIHPRRKAGQDTTDSKGPVVLTRSILESYFDLPLINAAAEMGLSCTALKKVCRKMGISNWPYRFRDELCRSPGSLSRGSSPPRSPMSPTSPLGSPRGYRAGPSAPIQQRLQSSIDTLPPGDFDGQDAIPEHGFRSTSRRRPYLTSSHSLPDLSAAEAASGQVPQRAPYQPQPHPLGHLTDGFAGIPANHPFHAGAHQVVPRSSSTNALSQHPAGVMPGQQHQQADMGQFGNFTAPRYHQSPYEQQQHRQAAPGSAAWHNEADVARSTADLSSLALREPHGVGGGGAFEQNNHMSNDFASHPADQSGHFFQDKQWGQHNGFAPEPTAADFHHGPIVSLSIGGHPSTLMEGEQGVSAFAPVGGGGQEWGDM